MRKKLPIILSRARLAGYISIFQIHGQRIVAKANLFDLDSFLTEYDQILQRDGVVEFKTDNRPLFDFSLEQLQEAGWHADYVSYHLHENGPAANNIITPNMSRNFMLDNASVNSEHTDRQKRNSR